MKRRMSTYYHLLLISFLLLSPFAQAKENSTEEKEWNKIFTLVKFKGGNKITKQHRCVWLKRQKWSILRRACTTGVNAVTDHASVVCPMHCKPFQEVECGLLCEDRPTKMDFKFLGGTCEDSKHEQPEKVTCVDNGVIGYPAHVIMKPSGNKGGKGKDGEGSEVYFNATVHNQNEIMNIGNGEEVTADMDVEVYNYDQEKKLVLVQKITYHSSCSGNLSIGDIFGSVKLVGFTNKDQGKVKGCFGNTHAPTPIPTFKPTPIPTFKPTPIPTFKPTFKPTRIPTTKSPIRVKNTSTKEPSPSPTTKKPTLRPTVLPTSKPSPSPSSSPSRIPTSSPSRIPSSSPSVAPSSSPSKVPSICISPVSNDNQPTDPCMSEAPSVSPTRDPSSPCIERKRAKFVRTFSSSNEPIRIKSCRWLQGKGAYFRGRICETTKASEVCLITCGICTPETTLLRKLGPRRNIK